MEDYQERMQKESDELMGRITKLKLFIEDEVFANLPDVDRVLLVVQLGQMEQYYWTLNDRIGRIHF